MTDDLVTWLRAQLDEDERIARAAAPAPWTYQNVESVGGGRICDPTVAIAEMHYELPDVVDPRTRRTVLEVEADGTGEHIARHDPARVLAEVDAKRRILDVHPLEGPSKYVPFQYCGTCQDGDGIPTGPAPCPTQNALALPFADRPGYRERWGQ